MTTKTPLLGCGAAIQPGMNVWFWNGFPDCEITGPETVKNIWWSDEDEVWYINDESPANWFYSSEELAERAKQQPKT